MWHGKRQGGIHTANFWVEWRENGLRKQINTPRGGSPPAPPNLSPPLQSPHHQSLSTLSSPRSSPPATPPTIHSIWLQLPNPTKTATAKVPNFLQVTSHSSARHRWPLPPTEADSPGFCVRSCLGFPPHPQTALFLDPLLTHLPLLGCSRWVPQSH